MATEFFDSSADRGSSPSRNGEVRCRSGGGGGGDGGSVKRGRSVSRQGAKGNDDDSSAGGRAVLGNNNNNSRRRSVSVVRYQVSDSESDLDHSNNSSNRSSQTNNFGSYSQTPLSQRATVTNHKPALRRSLSQKDLKYNDGYSSQSSALTDDEMRDSHCVKNEVERTIRAVYAQKRLEHPTADDLNCGLYDVMRKELRHAVEEIKMELEQGMTKAQTNINDLQSKNFDALQTAATIRRNYTTKLEQQSEKRRQELFAEIVLEEQRGRELSKIVQELIPDPKESIVEKPFRTRKRSNDRSRVSKRLTEEAEKIFEDFISNIEDTDISSLDGERSDTSSTLGGITKTETFQSPAMSKPLPARTDGIILPWLQWETTSDVSPRSCKNNAQSQALPKTKFSFSDGSQESTAEDLSYHPTSSHGRRSGGVFDGFSISFRKDKGSKYREPGSCLSQFLPNGKARLGLDLDEYLKLEEDEDFLLERWRQQQRINSGGLLLCNHVFF